VPASAPDTLCVLAHITNVRVYASDEEAAEGEKALIDSCNHKSQNGGYDFLDNGDKNYDEVRIAHKCLCGEVTFEAKEPQYVFFFDSIEGSASTGNKFLAAENSKGFKTIDLESEITTDSNGKLVVNGWAGMNGGFTKIVYKVYSSSGEELTNGWCDPSSVTINPTAGAVADEMIKRNIEKEHAKSVRGFTLDLSSYLTTQSNITVKLAFVSEGAEKAGINDKYLPFVDIVNINK
jgi:hypothetical protein